MSRFRVKYSTALQATLSPAPANNEYLQSWKNPVATSDVFGLLLEHGVDIAAYVLESEYGDALTAAKQAFKDDPECLDQFMELAESRGVKLE